VGGLSPRVFISIVVVSLVVLVALLVAVSLQPSSKEYNPVEYGMLNLAVDDFSYCLQYDEFSSRADAVSQLSSSEYDLLILDAYYSCSHEEGRWTANEIASMNSSSSPKVLLCYVSIGEAEDYRKYWNQNWDADDDGVPDAGAPEWLDEENAEWEGNYKVKYWLPGWQQVIFGSVDSYVDKALLQGFSGVYLDLIDAYEYYEQKGDPTAGQRMVDFVSALSHYSKSKNPNFLVVPQNGEALATYPGYLDRIDGIGREDILYTGDLRNSQSEIDDAEKYLSMFQSANKFVLEVEYPTWNSRIDACYEYAAEQGYLCSVCPIDLDTIQVNDGYEPD